MISMKKSLIMDERTDGRIWITTIHVYPNFFLKWGIHEQRR